MSALEKAQKRVARSFVRFAPGMVPLPVYAAGFRRAFRTDRCSCIFLAGARHLRLHVRAATGADAAPATCLHESVPDRAGSAQEIAEEPGAGCPRNVHAMSGI